VGHHVGSDGAQLLYHLIIVLHEATMNLVRIAKQIGHRF
jgi:hypothetical protein